MTVPPVRQAVPWIWFGLAAAILLVHTMTSDLQGLSAASDAGLRVFGSFWASGWAVDHGLDPYAVYPMTARSPLASVPDVNLSPPALMPLFALMGRQDPGFWAGWWIVLQACIFVAASALALGVAACPVARWQTWWLLLMPQVLQSIWLGQDYAVLYGLVVLAWVLLRRGGDVGAGICIGLFVAAKPNFVLWPLFLVLCGYRRPAFLALACAAAVSVIPVPLFGATIYSQWFAAVAADRHWLITTDVSLHGLFARLGAGPAGLGLSGLLILASGFLAWCGRLDLFAVSGLALAVGSIASPLGWSAYVVFLLPAFVDGGWGRMRNGAAALLTVPPGIPLLMMGHGRLVEFLGGLIYTAAFALIIGGMMLPLGQTKAGVRGSAIPPALP